METQTFKITQKISGHEIGRITIDGNGDLSYTLSANEKLDPTYQQQTLERIIHGCCDSFGRVIPFITEGDKVRASTEKPLTPGQDTVESILTSVRNYMRVMEKIYDIEEI